MESSGSALETEGDLGTTARVHAYAACNNDGDIAAKTELIGSENGGLADDHGSIDAVAVDLHSSMPIERGGNSDDWNTVWQDGLLGW